MPAITDDTRILGLRPLLPPAILLEELPVDTLSAEFISATRAAIGDVVHGRDRRLLVVVGPCSIHDAAAALEYADRLRDITPRLSSDLLIAMRVYFEKPRTTVGWKGLINDPDLDGSFSINKGLRLARGLLRELAVRRVPVACEFLDTITPQFLADVVAWGAIGARTAESQVHRELASGLSMPVGFKNGTDGNFDVAIDAVRAASHPHHFLSVTKQGIAAIVATAGNPDGHVILRGGKSGPNFAAPSVEDVTGRLTAAGLSPRVMIDLSHGNSGKDPLRQRLGADSVAAQIASGSKGILGVMIESHLVSGRQDVSPGRKLTYGQSITDACLGWAETVPLLEQLASAVRQARSSSPSASPPASVGDGPQGAIEGASP